MIKLYLILFLIIGFIVLQALPNGKKIFYFTAITCTFIRNIDVPYFSEVAPAYFMFAILNFSDLKFFLNRFFKSWLTYFLALIFAVFVGYFLNSTFSKWEWFQPFFVVILIAISTEKYITDKRDEKILLNILISISLIFSLTAIAGYLGFYDGVIIFGNNIESQGLTSVVYGISYTNNVMIISSIGICFLPFIRINKTLKLLIILIISYSVLITLKRTAIISLLMSVSYFIFREGKRNHQVIWLIGISGIYIYNSSLFDILQTRFYSAINTFDTGIYYEQSSYTRLNRLNIAYNLFIKSPIIGHGAGKVIFVHNGFLEIAANMGLIGLVVVNKLLFPIKKINRNNPFSIATLIFISSVFFFEAAISISSLMYFLGIYMGGFVVVNKISNK